MSREALIFSVWYILFMYFCCTLHDLNQLREIVHLFNAYSSQKHGSPTPTLAHGDLTPRMNSEMEIHPAERNETDQPAATAPAKAAEAQPAGSECVHT